MNHSKKNVGGFIICNVSKLSLKVLNQFPNKIYERIQLGMIVFNCILLFSTISLNGVAVITIRKSSQLKSKMCYFVILLQCIVDLGVGFLGIPLFVYGLSIPFQSEVNCIPIVVTTRASYLPLGLSIATLSAMTMERYVGVVHPFHYKTKVTKKRILTYVCGNGVILLLVLAFFLRNSAPMRFYVRGSIAAFFLFTLFVYTRIYLVIRKLIRSEKRPAGDGDGNEVRRQIKREIRRARSCFLVIVCFFILLTPFALYASLLMLSSSTYSGLFFNGGFTLIILNSSVNSVIFFWTKTLLGKEALKILSYFFS